MKTIPKRFPEVWTKAESDPDGKVEFLISPLTNRLQLYIGAKNSGSEGSAVVDSLALSLKGIRGLEDTETGKEFHLQFENIKVGKHVEKRVTDDSIDSLPTALVVEIMQFMTGQNNPTEEEKEQVGFTSGPSIETSIVTGVAEPVTTSEPASIIAPEAALSLSDGPAETNTDDPQ